MQADLERILFDEATIHRRLDELAAKISQDYRDRELTVIAILNGSLILAGRSSPAHSSAAQIGLPERRQLSRRR